LLLAQRAERDETDAVKDAGGVAKLPVEAFEVRQGEELIMTLGLGLTLYFPRPFSAVRKELLKFWCAYLEEVPPSTFTWARLGGGNRSRATSPAVFKTIASWLDGSKPAGDTCWISIHDGPMDAMGAHGFMLSGEGAAKSEYDEESGFVEMTFPLSLLTTSTPDELAEKFIRLASKVPFVAGVAGLTFQRSPYKFNALIEPMGVLSKRYLGVEISAAERLCYLAARGLPSVNWITFVGTSHLPKLGGFDKLATDLLGISTVAPLPFGVAVVTGKGPVLGDVERPDDGVRALKRAYEVLRAAQFADEDYAFHGIRFPGDATVEWLTRWS